MNPPPSDPNLPTPKLRLAELPPTAELDAWRARAGGDWRWKQDIDATAPPLFTRKDIESLPHLGRPFPVQSGMWQARERIACASTQLAAEQAQAAVAGGIEQLELRLDTCFFEVGPDEAGLCGIPIGTAEDLTVALAPVDIAQTALCLDGDALLGLALLLDHGRRTGTPTDVLHGELGFDPIEGLDQFGDPALTRPRWNQAETLVVWCTANAPRLRALALHSRWLHEAGASDALELASLIAGATETVRQLGDRGQSFDTVAANLVFRVSVSTDLLGQVAKLRALRLLWAKVAAAFSPAGEPLPAATVVAYSSDRARARRFDLHTNLLRGTLEAVAATLGCCDGLCLTPLDPHPDYQDDGARLLARHQHALLRDEGFFGQVTDPTAGSFAIEWLTDDVARRGWALVQEIERRGGMTAAMCDGFVIERLHRDASARLTRMRTRERVRVGVSRYVDPTLERERHLLHDRSPVVQRMEDRMAARGTDGARDLALDKLREAIEAHSAEVVPAATQAAAVGCSAFEIADALSANEAGQHAEDDSPDREIVPTPEPDDVAHDPLTTDAVSFEDLRAMLVEDGLPPRALVAMAGTDRTARERSGFAADLLRAGGFDVQTEEVTPDDLTQLVAELEPEILVLCTDRDPDAGLCAELTGGPVLVVACPPVEALRAQVDAFLFEGADALLRLDYLARLVELARLGENPGDELEQSLRETIATMRSYLEREETPA